MKKSSRPLAIMSLLVLFFLFVLGQMVRPVVLRKASFEGTVIDEVSGKPVAGALVFMHWATHRRYLPVELHFWAPESSDNNVIGESLSASDSEGKFITPKETIVRWVHWLTGSPSLQVLVYKRGYVAYRNDGYFDGYNYELTYVRRKSYPKTGGVVRLRPWDEEFKHWKHLEFINGDLSVATPDVGSNMHKAWSWEDTLSILEMRQNASAQLGSSTPLAIDVLEMDAGPIPSAPGSLGVGIPLRIRFKVSNHGQTTVFDTGRMAIRLDKKVIVLAEELAATVSSGGVSSIIKTELAPAEEWESWLSFHLTPPRTGKSCVLEVGYVDSRGYVGWQTADANFEIPHAQ